MAAHEDFVGIRVLINENVLKRKLPSKYYRLVNKIGIIRVVYTNRGGHSSMNFGIEILGVPNKESQYGYFYFKESEFSLQADQLTGQLITKENEMSYNHNLYKGKFRVATVKFLDYESHEVNYRIYDDGFEYKEGDYVVVSPAHHKWTVAQIKLIFDYDVSAPADENREVICPVDISKFTERSQKAKEIIKLKQEMDKKVKELQGVALYELMAEKSPELQEMLTQYKTLVQG